MEYNYFSKAGSSAVVCWKFLTALFALSILSCKSGQPPQRSQLPPVRSAHTVTATPEKPRQKQPGHKVVIITTKRHTITKSATPPKKNIFPPKGEILTVSLAAIALFLSYRAFRRDKRNKNLDFLAEVDKQLIATPYLWAIYDIHRDKFQPNDSITPEALEMKLTAFCYFHLNNFEPVFRDLFVFNKQHYVVWRNYMVHLIATSTLFRDIMEREIKGFVYTQDYQKRMERYLKIAQPVIDLYEQRKAGTIDDEVFHSKTNKYLKELREPFPFWL